MIAGGSLEDGTASRAVLEYTPATGRVSRIGELPVATTHAAAAALGSTVYVIGGRGATLDTPVTSIVSVDLQSKRIRTAGHLLLARSDLAAVDARQPDPARGRTSAQRNDGVAERARRHGSSISPRPIATSRRRLARRLRTRRRRHARPCRARGALADLRAEQPEQHRRRDRPAHLQGRRALRRRRPAPARRAGLGPEDALRHQRRRATASRRSTRARASPGRPIPVDDPYNMYFTPDGRYAIVVAERLRRLDFRDPHTFKLHHSLTVPVRRRRPHGLLGGRHATCSRAASSRARSSKVDVADEQVVGTLTLPDGAAAMPQDVKLSPDGKVFYVADMHADGVWEIDGIDLKVHRLPPHRRRRARPLPEPRREAAVRHQPDRRVDLRDQLPHAQGRRDVANPRRRQPRHGRRLGRREGALALRPLQRRRLRDLDARPAGCSPRSRSAAGRTASASGRSPAATRSATPASCGNPGHSQVGWVVPRSSSLHRADRTVSTDPKANSRGDLCRYLLTSCFDVAASPTAAALPNGAPDPGTGSLPACALEQ